MNYVSIGGAVISASAVYIAVYNNNRQLGAQIFLTYSNRLQLLRRSLSPEKRSLRFLDDEHDELNAESRQVVAEGIYLIFEFYSLRRHGYVGRRIWNVWEPDIVQLLKSSIVQREWEHLRSEFEIHPKFAEWVSRYQTPCQGVCRSSPSGHPELTPSR
jgi:hypothetical protein